MLNVLRAEYRRLFRSKIFLLGSVGCFAVGACISLYFVRMNKRFDDFYFADGNLFMFGTFCGILSAVLTSLFVGKLYSDGTMRNQIIMGHNRASVYLCEYLTALSANILFFVSYVFGSLLIAYPVFGKFGDPPAMFAKKTVVTVAVIAVYTAVFVLFSMTNKNKAVTAIICLLSAFGLIFCSMIIFSSLSEPEEYEEAYYFDTEQKTLVKEEKKPNPNYIGGTRRKVYEFLNDFLPAGQAFQIGGNYDQPTVKMIFPVYDLLIVLTACFIGMMIYKRKDLN